MQVDTGQGLSRAAVLPLVPAQAPHAVALEGLCGDTTPPLSSLTCSVPSAHVCLAHSSTEQCFLNR